MGDWRTVPNFWICAPSSSHTHFRRLRRFSTAASPSAERMINRAIQSGVVCSALGTVGAWPRHFFARFQRIAPRRCQRSGSKWDTSPRLSPVSGRPGERQRVDPDETDTLFAGSWVSRRPRRSASNCSRSVLGSRPRFGGDALAVSPGLDRRPGVGAEVRALHRSLRDPGAADTQAASTYWPSTPASSERSCCSGRFHR